MCINAIMFDAAMIVSRVGRTTIVTPGILGVFDPNQLIQR